MDCSAHYNMERVRNIDFTKSKDLFIHGMINDDNGGTCSSMPALYVAVGRRLGYPLKLVETKSHLFVRWDGQNDANPAWRERFNIEGAGNGHGFFPDDYYKTWPEKCSDFEIRINQFLTSMSPPEELASFLGHRGFCLWDNGRRHEALEAFVAAHVLAPQRRAYLVWARNAEEMLIKMEVDREASDRRRAKP